jgi:hypothetical protein
MQVIVMEKVGSKVKVNQIMIKNVRDKGRCRTNLDLDFSGAPIELLREEEDGTHLVHLVKT